MAAEGGETLVDDAGEGNMANSSYVPTTEANEHSQQADTPDHAHAEPSAREPAANGEAQLSKNALKRIRKKEEYEAGREQRKVVRKEKNKAKRERKKETYQAQLANAAETRDGSADDNEKANAGGYGQDSSARLTRKPPNAVQLPITFIFDCSYDDLMKDGELISLASQLTRCYSENRKSPSRAHLVLSSFNGRLRERYETVLARHHENWKGVRFLEEDFAVVAEQAKKWMTEKPHGGRIAGALCKPSGEDKDNQNGSTEAATNSGEIVYLSSDSPHTLSELKPYSTYIIGGLVDRNRHKGICYKSALKHNIRTARLPIGEFIEMSTRAVLATNHVNEIMLKWLKLGDWGKAFFEVIPKRKGGKLRENGSSTATEAIEAKEEEDSEAEQDVEIEDTDEASVANTASKDAIQTQTETYQGMKRKLEAAEADQDITQEKKARQDSITT